MVRRSRSRSLGDITQQEGLHIKVTVTARFDAGGAVFTATAHDWSGGFESQGDWSGRLVGESDPFSWSWTPYTDCQIEDLPPPNVPHDEPQLDDDDTVML